MAVGAEELEIDTADEAARRCVAALSPSLGSGCFSCSDSMVGRDDGFLTTRIEEESESGYIPWGFESYGFNYRDRRMRKKDERKTHLLRLLDTDLSAGS